MSAFHDESATPTRRRSPLGWLLALLVIAGVGYGVFYTLQQRATPPVLSAPVASRLTPAPPVAVPPATLKHAYRLFYSVMDNEGYGQGTPRLYSINADGTGKKKYAHPCGTGYCGFESVAADGKHVAYTDGTDVSRELYISAPDGTGAIKLNAEDPEILDSATFSPDGKQLVYRQSSSENADTLHLDLYLTAIDGASTVRLTDTPEDERPVGFSADGTQLFFTRTINEKDVPMEMELATRRTREIAAATLPPPAGLTAEYTRTTKKTGKTITVGVDGVEDTMEETVDDLYLTPSTGGKQVHVAHGFEIVVLGWARA